MSKNSVRIWIVMAVLSAVGVAPFLARGDQATRKQLETNRQTMAKMTESQRDQLDRNFAAYQAMPPEKIAELEAFHQGVELDRKKNAGQLASALHQYDEWLNTIEPFQRDQLKKTTDPQERLRLMTEIVREQRARDATSSFRRRFEHTPLAHVPVLKDQELNYFMGQVEQLEAKRLSIPQRSELNRNTGIARFLALLEMLKENSRGRPGNRGDEPRFIVKDLLLTFRNIESSLGRIVQDEEVKEYLMKESEIPAVLRIQAVIIKSIFLQVEEQTPPTLSSQQQLEQLFSKLPEEEQDQLLQLEAIDFYKELLARNEPLDTHDDFVTQRDVSEVFEMNHWWSKGKRPPRPPGNSRDGRPDGPPPGGSGDRDRGGYRGDGRPRDRDRPSGERDGRPLKERFENRGPQPTD